MLQPLPTVYELPIELCQFLFCGAMEIYSSSRTADWSLKEAHATKIFGHQGVYLSFSLPKTSWPSDFTEENIANYMQVLRFFLKGRGSQPVDINYNHDADINSTVLSFYAPSIWHITGCLFRFFDYIYVHNNFKKFISTEGTIIEGKWSVDPETGEFFRNDAADVIRTNPVEDVTWVLTEKFLQPYKGTREADTVKSLLKSSNNRDRLSFYGNRLLELYHHKQSGFKRLSNLYDPDVMETSRLFCCELLKMLASYFLGNKNVTCHWDNRLKSKKFSDENRIYSGSFHVGPRNVRFALQLGAGEVGDVKRFCDFLSPLLEAACVVPFRSDERQAGFNGFEVYAPIGRYQFHDSLRKAFKAAWEEKQRINAAHDASEPAASEGEAAEGGAGAEFATAAPVVDDIDAAEGVVATSVKSQLDQVLVRLQQLETEMAELKKQLKLAEGNSSAPAPGAKPSGSFF